MNQPLRAKAKVAAVVADGATNSDPYNLVPRLPQQRALPAATRSDALDLAQLWATVRQHYRFVLLVAVATFALVMTATLASRMKFRAVGRLYLGELEEATPSNAARSSDFSISANNQGVIGSEVEIIQSRSLVSRAILDSGLNTNVVPSGQPTPRYGAWLLSRRNPAILDAASEQLRATGSELTDPYSKERAFDVRFVSDTRYEVSSAGRALGTGQLGETLTLPGAKLMLATGEGAPKPGSAYEITLLPLQDVTDATLAALFVSAPKPLPPAQPVNVVTLEFTARSPRIAARFLDSLMAAYLNERQTWKAEDATAAEAFVTNQLTKTRDSLDSLQQKLAEYRSANRVVVNDNEAKAMIEQIGKYEEQRVSARLEVAELSELQKTLGSANPSVGALLLGGTTDTVIERMASSLSEARQRLTDLGTRFNDAAPDVRAQREQVDSQLQAIRNYVASRADRARENLGTIDGIIKQFESKLDTLPGAEVGLAQLSRESDVYDRMYTYLLERQQQTAIIRASTLSKNRVLDAPDVSFREDSPKLLLRLASLPLGLLFGVFLVLLRSFLASTFQTETDVRSAGLGLPIFATLPHLRRRTRGAKRFGGSLDLLSEDMGSPLAEACRMLRANVYRWGASSAGKVVLITSPNAGDGKTTTTLALAAVLAADGKRVLVVDADLRKPNHPVPAGEESVQLGLREVLSGQCSWSEAAQSVATAAGQFYAIPSGGPAPVELLSQPRMAELMQGARTHCDYLLIDAPSFPTFSDALVLAMGADAVLSVVRLQNSSRKLALEHVRGLGSVAPTHALLINDVGFSDSAPVAQPRAAVHGPRPLLRRPGKRSLWWASALLLVAVSAAALFTSSAAAGFAQRAASALHH